MSAGRRRFVGELVLWLTTMGWGTTFAVVQQTLQDWPPLYLLSVRFGVATLTFLPFIIYQRYQTRDVAAPPVLVKGMILGGALFIGFALQTWSLMRTSAAHTAFATALVTLLVPILGFLTMRWRLSFGTYVALVAAGGGIACIFGGAHSAGMQTGDLMAVACAFAFATQIILLTRFSQGVPLLPLLCVELVTGTVLALTAAQLAGEQLPASASQGAFELGYLGVVATAACLGGQMFGQSRTTANRAAFIFAGEQAFAALFGWLWLGVTLSSHELIGMTLMTTAAITADRRLPVVIDAAIRRRLRRA